MKLVRSELIRAKKDAANVPQNTDTKQGMFQSVHWGNPGLKKIFSFLFKY